MDIKIIFEDDYFIVINKPRGIVVNRAESVKTETIQDWAEEKLGIKNIELRIKNYGKDTSSRFDPDSEMEDPKKDFYNRAGIVHRLDKETSGLLLIARDPETFVKLQQQFKDRSIKKKYITLVHGKVAPNGGEIIASVGRLPWNRERFGVLAGGREAATSYKTIGNYSLDKEKYTLLEVSPLSGRTHQIRIHLKYIGHSVVGDNFYAGRKTYRRDQEFCPYLFLHAKYLKMAHPKTGDIIEFNCELPEGLKQVLEKMTVEKPEDDS